MGDCGCGVGYWNRYHLWVARLAGLFGHLAFGFSLASAQAARSVTPKWVTNEPSGPGNMVEEKRRKHKKKTDKLEMMARLFVPILT